jgi:RNA polymerase sigma-70 factor (ECF subfamily)
VADIDNRTLKQIDIALAKLPARTRYVFEQHRIHGVSQKQIAKELGVSNTLVNFMVRDALLHCCKEID